jgi:hypothetical protein
MPVSLLKMTRGDFSVFSKIIQSGAATDFPQASGAGDYA